MKQLQHTQKHGKDKNFGLISFLLFAHHIFEFFLRKLSVPVFVISCKDCLNLEIRIISCFVSRPSLTCAWVNFLVVFSISCLVIKPSLFLSISLKAISALCCCWDFSFSSEVSNMDTISALLLLQLKTGSEKVRRLDPPTPSTDLPNGKLTAGGNADDSYYLHIFYIPCFSQPPCTCTIITGRYK